MEAPRSDTVRARVTRLIESRITQRFIIGVILLNAVTLGLETSASAMAMAGPLLLNLDRLILGIFTVEVAAKMWIYGRRFWRDPWNVFDFLVVSISLMPTPGPFSVLRVLRLLRLVSMIPKLRFIVEALLHAVPGIVSILGLLTLVFYVCAIIATGLFGEAYPDWFGTLGASLYTLFQIMTLESWSMGISRPVMETFPWAWIFFVPFILISTFTVLNLFIAIIVDAMQRIEADKVARHEADVAARGPHELDETIRSIEGQLEEMREQLQRLRALRSSGAALRD